MGSPSATPRLLYRSTRLLRTAFQHLHQQQQRADVFCDVVLLAEGERVAWPMGVPVALGAVGERNPQAGSLQPPHGGSGRQQGGDGRCCFAGEAVVAHCCVLSVCSPFFMEQLGQELPPRGRRVVLELGGLKIGALRKLVRFLYTAELEATQEEVQEVLAAARHLRVTELESLQLRGGRLVRPGHQRQLDRSCLCPPQHNSPTVAGSKAEPDSAGTTHESTSIPSRGQLCSPGTVHPSHGPVGRVKLRKVESGGCWEVVREKQPPAAPGAVAAGDAGVTESQPHLDVGALGRVGRRSPCQQPPWAAWSKQGQAPPVSQQGFGQAVPPGDSSGDPEEEVDVGTVEPCLPPGTVCVWPCPSSESDEEVDILT